MVIWIAAILLITAVALFVAAPLSDRVSKRSAPATGAESQRRAHDHALAVQALRDLEFDHAMGKLDADDYHALRQRLEIRALTAMGEREKTPGALSADRVAPVVRSSQSIAAALSVIANFCFQCGNRLAQAHNFCPNCGAGRTVTATGEIR